MAQILVEIAPEVYGTSITYDNGKSVIYLELLKSLYVMLIASLLFYQKSRKDMEAIGFKVNPYDPCMANKMIHDKTMTITGHVDDMKFSHYYKDVVEGFIQFTTDINPSSRKIHEYLAMTLDYTISGEVKIYVKEYIYNN